MNNKKLALILACAAMAGTSACNEVAEFCDGQSRCDNNVITICDGNKVVSVINCNDTNQVCDTATWTCVDQKPACTEGATQCSGTIIQTCTNGAWVNGTDCNTTNQICDSTANPVVCKDQEPGKVCEEGVKQCDGEVLQVCRDNAWATDTDCATLDNKECKADGNGSFACVDKTPVACTTEGEKQCASNVLQVCEDGNWKDDTNCANNTDGKIVCGDNNGTAACVAPAGCDDKAHGDIRCKADSEADREICDNGTWKPTDACSGDTPVCIADNTDGAKCVVCKNDTYKDCTVEAVVDDYGYAEPKYNVKKCADNQWTDDVCPDDMICNADGTACVDKTDVLDCGEAYYVCTSVGSTEYFVTCYGGEVYEEACLNNTVCDLDTQSCAKVSCADDAACNESKLASITCGDNPAYDGKASYFKKGYVDTDNDDIVDGLACTADCTFDYDTYCYTCDDTRECDPNEDYTCEDIDSSKTWKAGGVPVCDGCLLTQGTCEEDSGVEPPTDGGLFISEILVMSNYRVIEIYNSSSDSVSLSGYSVYDGTTKVRELSGELESGKTYILCGFNNDSNADNKNYAGDTGTNWNNLGDNKPDCDLGFNYNKYFKNGSTVTLKNGDAVVDISPAFTKLTESIRKCGVSGCDVSSGECVYNEADWVITTYSRASEFSAWDHVGAHSLVCASCEEPEVSDGIGGCTEAPSCEGDGETIVDGNCVCDAASNYYGEVGACVLCSGDGKIIKDNACICDADNKYYGDDTCSLCEGDGKIIKDNACICDADNKYYGDDTCSLCEGDGKIIKDNACICDADNHYVDNGEGGCQLEADPYCVGHETDEEAWFCKNIDGADYRVICKNGYHVTEGTYSTVNCSAENQICVLGTGDAYCAVCSAEDVSKCTEEIPAHAKHICDDSGWVAACAWECEDGWKFDNEEDPTGCVEDADACVEVCENGMIKKCVGGELSETAVACGDVAHGVYSCASTSTCGSLTGCEDGWHLDDATNPTTCLEDEDACVEVCENGMIKKCVDGELSETAVACGEVAHGVYNCASTSTCGSLTGCEDGWHLDDATNPTTCIEDCTADDNKCSDNEGVGAEITICDTATGIKTTQAVDGVSCNGSVAGACLNGAVQGPIASGVDYDYQICNNGVWTNQKCEVKDYLTASFDKDAENYCKYECITEDYSCSEDGSTSILCIAGSIETTTCLDSTPKCWAKDDHSEGGCGCSSASDCGDDYNACVDSKCVKLDCRSADDEGDFKDSLNVYTPWCDGTKATHCVNNKIEVVDFDICNELTGADNNEANCEDGLFIAGTEKSVCGRDAEPETCETVTDCSDVFNACIDGNCKQLDCHSIDDEGSFRDGFGAYGPWCKEDGLTATFCKDYKINTEAYKSCVELAGADNDVSNCSDGAFVKGSDKSICVKECTSHSDCTDENAPSCIAGKCDLCSSNEDCAEGEICDEDTMACIVSNASFSASFSATHSGSNDYTAEGTIDLSSSVTLKYKGSSSNTYTKFVLANKTSNGNYISIEGLQVGNYSMAITGSSIDSSGKWFVNVIDTKVGEIDLSDASWSPKTIELSISANTDVVRIVPETYGSSNAKKINIDSIVITRK